MWVILGDPKFSMAVPCWTNMSKIADPVEGSRGGEIGEIARILRDASLTQSKGKIRTERLLNIWKSTWPEEERIIQETVGLRKKWAETGFQSDFATTWHTQNALKA